MARLVVMKLGSSIVADDRGELRADIVEGVCSEVARLHDARVEQSGARGGP